MPFRYIPGDYRPGVVVGVPVTTEVGTISHKGIMTDKVGPDGCPTVVHSAKLFQRRVVETTMSDFCLKAVGPMQAEGYPGELPPDFVVARARSQIGKPWFPWDNCEHFIAWAHGVKQKSPQLRSGVKRGVAGASALAALVMAVRFLK
jgi:hypothetical protein